MQESYYWDLIRKHLENKTSPSENIELLNWVNLNEENRKNFEVQKKLWLHTAPGSLDFKAEERWEMLKSRINKEKHSRIIPFQFILKIAASITLLVVANSVLWYFLFNSSRIITVTATEDHNMSFILPDKTVVWLKKNSELKYPKKFEGNERNISLSGEAFFEVYKDPTKPFIITAKGTITEVLGTSFNLKATPEESMVSVSVFTGKVAFYDQAAINKKLILMPGNTGIYDKEKSGFVKLPNEVPNLIAWKTGILKFNNTPMSEVVEDLEDIYSKKIVIENQELLRCSITSQFNNVSLEKILNELKLMLAIQYSIKDDKVILSEGSCH